jgi:hypothetical protein
VRRLEHDSVALGPDAVWVAPHGVLREPATVRSKWLQRALGLEKSTVGRLGAALAAAKTDAEAASALAPLLSRGRKPEPAGALVVDASADRRRSGSHYTPEALALKVVERTLAPLMEGASSERLLSLRICDPAMGSGAFLSVAARFLAEAVTAAWRRESRAEPAVDLAPRAMSAVIRECIHGVDKDPVATDLARAGLALLATSQGEPPPDLSAHLKTGDALVGRLRERGVETLSVFATGFDWPSEFETVFTQGGFDACVGNPPWVAYAGRAAQPLDESLARHYEATNPAFFGYRTLHGLFVRRAAELVREGGRIGLVLPTSVADLAGYAPTRDAHDTLCDVDEELLDFGDGAFAGVFQPCMALTSTRVEGTRARRTDKKIWPLGRTDLDAAATGLLARLDALPRIPAELFGERGFQTTGDDLSHLRRLAEPAAPFLLPIREGGDIGEFRTGAPRTFLDPTGLRGRLRDTDDWRSVGVLIRQTARYPIASLADGVAFRNSILAGFAGAGWTAPALTAFLNSSAVRWYHYARHRDARQGMPQLKIGHLRALPDVTNAAVRQSLHHLGAALAARNTGVAPEERHALDDLVAGAFGLDDAERARVERWASENPLPAPRGSMKMDSPATR